MTEETPYEVSDFDFYNVHEYKDPNPESCDCVPCKRYLIYRTEKERFKEKIYENILKPSEESKQHSLENCNCLNCQSKRRYQRCKEESSKSLCYQIRHNISLDDCDCEALIPESEVENYMHYVTSRGKNLPVEYMEAMMSRFQTCIPGLHKEKQHEFNVLDDKPSAESTRFCSHTPLPLPVFAPRSYDIQENRKNYDVYHMNAKEYGLSARSAFKLLQIDEKYGILKSAKRVVDLCAAPGGWSKVLSTRLFFGESDISQYSKLVEKYKENENAFQRNDIAITAVDLMDMLPIPGVKKILGDISKIETANAVILEFEGELADLVVCDGAADVSISMPMGDFMHRMVIFAALHITCNVLKQNGTFVMKVFYCDALLNWVKMVEELFDTVEVHKPDSSRYTSPECFLICQNYNPPNGFDPKLLTQYTSLDCKYDYSALTGVNKEIIPILVSDDYSYKEKNRNYLPFIEVYETHRKMFEKIDEKPRWKIELEELKMRQKDISEEEFDKDYEAILQRISERTKEDERLAKGARESIFCELEKRGDKRNLLEVKKFSKGRNKEMLKRAEWARDDALLCPETIPTPTSDVACEQQHILNILRLINGDKIIRNAECDRLRASGADQEAIIQRRIELYAEHQKCRFRDADIKSWVKPRESKGNRKKSNKKRSEEVLVGEMENIKL